MLLDPKISFPDRFDTFSLTDFLNGHIFSEMVISETQNLIWCNKNQISSKSLFEQEI